MYRTIPSVLALLCLLATGLRAQNAWLPWQTHPLNTNQSEVLSLQMVNDTLYFTATREPGQTLTINEHRRLPGSNTWTSQVIWSRPNSGLYNTSGDILAQHSGNQLVIGCANCDYEDAQGNPVSLTGYAYYGQRTPTGWDFEALPHPGGSAVAFQGEGFGFSVVLEGSRLAISAPWEANSNGYGRVYVYENVGGNWQTTALPNNPASFVNNLGYSLRADNNLIVASADSSEIPQVYAYRFDGTAWNVEYVNAPTINGWVEDFGRVIDYSNGRLAANFAYFDQLAGTWKYDIRDYTYNGTAWVLNPNTIDLYTQGFDLLDDTLVVLNYNSTVLEVYEASAGAWQLAQTVNVPQFYNCSSPQLVTGLMGLAKTVSQTPDVTVLYRRTPAARVVTRVYFDQNGNGQRDAGETAPWNQPVTATDGTTAQTVFNAIPSGVAAFDVPTGNYTFSVTVPTLLVAPQITEPATGTYTITLASNGLHPDTLDFGIYQTPVCDGSVNLNQTSAFRPGFSNSVSLLVSNNGSLPMQNVEVSIPLPTGYTYTGVSNPLLVTGSVTGGVLTLSFPDLAPQQTHYLVIYGTLDASVPMNTVLTLVSTLTNDCTPDTTPANNVDITNITVTTSFDPNDKTVMNHTPGHPELIDPSLNRLEYRIRFQNTGNDTAFNIVVVDTLEANLRPETFQMLAASHPYSVELVSDNILVWTFNNILLPDSNVNEPGSHGFVLFSIDRAAGLPLGTEITNGAAIYFDFNAPVITELSVVEINTVSGSADAVGAAGGVRAWPNPVRAGQVLSLSASLTGIVLDAHGRTVRNVQNATELPTEGLAPGMYLLRSQNGNALRFVIQ